MFVCYCFVFVFLICFDLNFLYAPRMTMAKSIKLEVEDDDGRRHKLRTAVAAIGLHDCKRISMDFFDEQRSDQSCESRWVRST